MTFKGCGRGIRARKLHVHTDLTKWRRFMLEKDSVGFAERGKRSLVSSKRCDARIRARLLGAVATENERKGGSSNHSLRTSDAEGAAKETCSVGRTAIGEHIRWSRTVLCSTPNRLETASFRERRATPKMQNKKKKKKKKKTKYQQNSSPDTCMEHSSFRSSCLTTSGCSCGVLTHCKRSRKKDKCQNHSKSLRTVIRQRYPNLCTKNTLMYLCHD